jgi:hypothetical protein
LIGQNESVQLSGEVAHHIVAFGLPMDEHVEADVYLEGHHSVDL